ncbi:MAG: hypothetical protein ACJ8C4_18455 [Gemmataceae bacterium]
MKALNLDWCLTLCRKYLLLMLGASYLLAAVCPGPGVSAKALSLDIGRGGMAFHVSMPMALLATLLFCAGVNCPRREINQLVRRPLVVFVGIIGNVLAPIASLYCVALVLQCWHNQREAQELLLGLSVVAAMPVAASSTAWAQSQRGDLPLSLGLLLGSTLLSPLSTPWFLHVVVPFLRSTPPLTDLQGSGSAAVLCACVVVPVALGLCVQLVLPGPISSCLKRSFRALSPLVLLSLCYVHASSALPQLLV